MMSRYLQYISPEQIDATNINQYLRNQKIISLTEEDYPGFMEELKVSLLAFAVDPVLHTVPASAHALFTAETLLRRHRRTRKTRPVSRWVFIRQTSVSI